VDLDELYRVLRSAHVQAQGVVDTLRDPILLLDPDLSVISANPAFYQTFDASRDATIGVPFDELGDGQWNIEELTFLLKRVIPKSASVFDYEVTTEFPHVGDATMLVSAQRLQHPDNRSRILLVSIVDATQARQRADEKDILIGELDHRIKNLLTVTHAVARQTRVEGRTAEEYRDVLLGRLEAVSRSMNTTSTDTCADLSEIARTVLEPFLGCEQTISVADAPTLSLSRKQAMSLGMILHELATNAVKYGALSVPDGQVSIDWIVSPGEEDTSEIQMRWEENNCPDVKLPETTGFGTRLIRFAAERELGGRVEQNYLPEGLLVTVCFPM